MAGTSVGLKSPQLGSVKLVSVGFLEPLEKWTLSLAELTMGAGEDFVLGLQPENEAKRQKPSWETKKDTRGLAHGLRSSTLVPA